MIAARSPTQTPPKKAENITPVKAATSMIPSIPKFVLPAFSATAQPNVAKSMGAVTRITAK